AARSLFGRKVPAPSGKTSWSPGWGMLFSFQLAGLDHWLSPPPPLQVCVPALTVTVKFGIPRPAVVAVLAGVVTLIGPVVAAAGAVAVICVAESTLKVAALVLNVTAVVPSRFVP